MSETMKTVAIPGIAWDIAADIYFPPNFDPKLKYPAVVSAHPIGSCKEQTSGNVYGKAMAKAGFVVVAFDASFQGASGGTPRFVENPEFRVSDFRYVVDYIQKSLPYVDDERIGVLGICGGGGYALNAAMTDYRFKCAVGVTPANFGRLARESFAQYDPVGALAKMAQQRKAEAQGADPFVLNYLPFASIEEAKRADIDMREAFEYYKTDRGKASNGCVSGLFSFNSAAVAWDAFAFAEKIMTRPFMVIAGDKVGAFGAYRDAQDIYARAASKEKHLVILPETSHYMLYDHPEATKLALDQILPFLKKHLGEAA
ncbi:alpha/beta-hydrolase [Aspergillus eucalypticola CBS 122712]|uniref:Alpha/beta-hydrolase n=1 Tax=Aspergillus eucalypticola (strain CBS 122712 / IBT 29274) TaxID=1448314 RepID=A0A317W8T8_ASPEC|nr:alpha/beta-hydrolase [Aspergillus eucalypticola CBS 122712]PWY82559.1 alpha/beta-hydrolase [Aspergillus eucalypticola CBS 122712]